MVDRFCKIRCVVEANPAALTDWKKVDSTKQLEGGDNDIDKMIEKSCYR